MAKEIPLTFRINAPLNSALDALAQKRRVPKNQVILRALTLYEIACQRVDAGQRIGFVGPDDKLTEEITGL